MKLGDKIDLPLDVPSKESSAQTEIDEGQSLEIEKLTVEVQRLANEVDREKFLFKFRIILIITLVSLSLLWLIMVLGLVIVSYKVDPLLTIPEKVIMVLIGSTTVNILGLLGIGAKWLYPSKG